MDGAGAREREQPVGEMDRAGARLVEAAERLPQRGRILLRQRQLGLRTQAGQRRAQLVRGIRDESALRLEILLDTAEQRVDGPDERHQLGRRVHGVDRAQVERAALVDRASSAGASARSRTRGRTRRARTRRPAAGAAARTTACAGSWPGHAGARTSRPPAARPAAAALPGRERAAPRCGRLSSPITSAVQRDVAARERAGDRRHLGIAGEHLPVGTAQRVLAVVETVEVQQRVAGRRKPQRRLRIAGRHEMRRHRAREVLEPRVEVLLDRPRDHEDAGRRRGEPQEHQRSQQPFDELGRERKARPLVAISQGSTRDRGR